MIDANQWRSGWACPCLAPPEEARHAPVMALRNLPKPSNLSGFVDIDVHKLAIRIRVVLTLAEVTGQRFAHCRADEDDWDVLPITGVTAADHDPSLVCPAPDGRMPWP